MKVVFCTPTYTQPFDEYLAAVEASIPALDAAGIEHSIVFEVGNAYISWARANMLRKVMTETDADCVMFIDHDLSWPPEAMLKVLQHPGDVVAGDYRYKTDDEEKYMGRYLTDDGGVAVTRQDGTLIAHAVPAGFLKVSREAVERYREAYPELIFGAKQEYIDLFSHGAYKGVWWGEDYAFSRRWKDCGGEIHLIPDLDITHHLKGKAFPGNLHKWLLQLPGGSLAEAA